MPEEKKSRYTEAQKRAAEKYLKESVEDIRIRVPKGQKAVIKAHAESRGESVNSFIGRAINEAMTRDTGNPIPQQAPTPKPPRTEQAERIAEQDSRTAEQAEPVTDPKPVKPVRPSSIRAFTDEEAQRVDLPRLLRDFRYQFEIQDLYGKSVLSDLLTKARENDPSRE